MNGDAYAKCRGDISLSRRDKKEAQLIKYAVRKVMQEQSVSPIQGFVYSLLALGTPREQRFARDACVARKPLSRGPLAGSAKRTDPSHPLN